MAGEAREKCAVGGIVNRDTEVPAAVMMVDVLFALQHRGDDASGIASQTASGGIEVHRGDGLVADVYNRENIGRMTGKMAVGHNLYPVNRPKVVPLQPEHRQPKIIQPYVDTAIGFAFGHNGNLPVTQQLETNLSKRNIRTKLLNDSGMMGEAIAQGIRSGYDLVDSVELAFPFFKGAFSCVAMHDGMVVAFRDKNGIRPLALGKFDTGYIAASETCALDIVNASYEREVAPGEMVIITEDGFESKQLSDGEEKLDLFEFVYFARPDSYLYERSVNEVRRQMGVQLALQHPPTHENDKNIVVVPVPDTSIPIAEAYAETLDLHHTMSIIKNRFVSKRSFQQTTQADRQQVLRRKHNVIREGIAGKDIILIDDSIVRLNTIPPLVCQLKKKGAISITVLIASPPVRFPDLYGIDTPDQNELAAFSMTPEQMRLKIGCDYLGFLSLSRLVKATGKDESKFTMSCFNNVYPSGIGDHKKRIKSPISMEYID